MTMQVTAILAAAGSSTRMGFDKLSFDLGGRTVLEQSVQAFDAHPLITDLVLVAGAGTRAAAEAAAARSGLAARPAGPAWPSQAEAGAGALRRKSLMVNPSSFS